jgi:hypothetical protein
MRNAVALLMAMSAAVAPDIAFANAGSPMCQASKAKLFDGMKQCGVTPDATIVDEGSSPKSINAKIRQDMRALGDAAVRCLAETFVDNQGQIDFLDESRTKAFLQIVDEVSLRNRRADLDHVYEGAIACGIAKEALARDEGGIEESVSLVIDTDEAPVKDIVLQCLANKTVNKFVLVDFADTTSLNRYYEVRQVLWLSEARSKANAVLNSFKLQGEFRPYNPALGTLKSYGIATEKFCGVKPGRYLKTNGPDFLQWKSYIGGLDDFPELAGNAGCIWAALTLADLSDHGASFGMMRMTNSVSPPSANSSEPYSEIKTH